MVGRRHRWLPACRLCWCCAPALAGRPGRRPLSHSHPAIPSVLSRRLGLVQVVPHRPKSYLRDRFFDAVAQLGGQTVRRSIHPFVSVYMLIICSVLSFLVILFHGKSNSEYTSKKQGFRPFLMYTLVPVTLRVRAARASERH